MSSFHLFTLALVAGNHGAKPKPRCSGGEQQRVAIARAIVNDPALILADEPTGALDSTTATGIIALFERFHCDGRTIILVTHSDEVADRAERQITLHDGRMVEDARQQSKVRSEAAGSGAHQ